MIYGIIPARYSSTRFPGKPLALINGKPMIQWVYEQAGKSILIQKICVATDDLRIKETVESFGGNVVMTAENHLSGTDRLAEVVSKIPEISIAVNIQGDEPLIPYKSIDDTVQLIVNNPEVEMSTMIRKASCPEDLVNENIVKVVTDKNAYALYFSRSCIPFVRNPNQTDHFLHVGIYAYRRETLLKLSSLEPAPIELSESLEQLRALYNGIKIKTALTDYTPIGVDTPEDLKKVEKIIITQNIESGIK